MSKPRRNPDRLPFTTRLKPNCLIWLKNQPFTISESLERLIEQEMSKPK